MLDASASSAAPPNAQPKDGGMWAAADPPPRTGNAIDVLIEGGAYFPVLEQAIRAALIAGWCITPEFGLIRDEPPVLLRELLGEAAEAVEVRVLLWAGAPVPVFKPSGASVRERRDQLARGTRIKAALDTHERPMHQSEQGSGAVDGGSSALGGAPAGSGQAPVTSQSSRLSSGSTSGSSGTGSSISTGEPAPVEIHLSGQGPDTITIPASDVNNNYVLHITTSGSAASGLAALQFDWTS